MSAQWEVQKALYTALSTDSAFMTKIGSRLFDEPQTNETYPYVQIGYMNEQRWNRLTNKGFEITATINIYTKAGRLGFKPAKEILVEMNRVLNQKVFAMTGYKMVQCYFDYSDNNRIDDKRIVTANYIIITQEV